MTGIGVEEVNVHIQGVNTETTKKEQNKEEVKENSKEQVNEEKVEE